MITFALLYYLLLVLFQDTNQTDASVSNKTPESVRIVGGWATTISRAKFVVNVRVNGQFYCGGSLVTPKIVITAAHCVDAFRVSELSVVGGATYLSDKGIERSVAKIIIPNEYNCETMDMDIAILKLSSAMRGANISTIALCKSKWKTNDFITVYGWGRLSEYNCKMPNQLRTVSVPIIEQTRCSDMYKGHGKITPAMFCAGDWMGKDSCRGDSGGPAVYKDQLCGVVSWGNGCGRRKFPGVYTNIMFAKDFIEKTMKMEGVN